MSEHDTAQLRLAGIKDGSFIQVEHAGALKGGSSKKVFNMTDLLDESKDKLTMIKDISIPGEDEVMRKHEVAQTALLKVSEAEAEILAQNF